MTKKTWKTKFLSSSIPLKFQTLNILKANNIDAEFDFSFNRYHGDTVNESSIDLLGNYKYHKNSYDEFLLNQADCYFAVECKYRIENKNWIFIPDIYNIEKDVNNVTYSTQFPIFDEFSRQYYQGSNHFELSNTITRCLKGVEINIATGEVVTKDIKHGINQLLYAMPYVLHDKFTNFMYLDLEDCRPFSIISILLTNAELRVLDKDLTIDKLKNIDQLDSISSTVPFVSVHNPVGPNLANHYTRIFNGFVTEHLNENDSKEKIDIIRYAINKANLLWSNPKAIFRKMEKGKKSGINKFGSRVIICNLTSLDYLLKQIIINLKETANNSLNILSIE